MNEPVHTNLDEVDYSTYLEKVNVDLLRQMPFVPQKMNDGRVMLILGFSSILPEESNEEQVLDAMKRIIVDAKKITDVVFLK